MAINTHPLMTIADLEAMPDDGNRYEIIERELFVSRAPGLTHQIVSDNIVHLIRSYLDTHPIGIVVSTPGLILSNYNGVIPDIVFFTHANYERVVTGERLTSAPDLIVEILSPGSEDISRDRVSKLQLYAKYAVPEYWIIDLETQAVEIYRSSDSSLVLVATVQNDDALTTQVLPGFSCPPRQVFASHLL